MSISCPLCQKFYKNNLAGNFTAHLENVHQMSLVDYVVEYELEGVIPKCACGYCDEMPSFRRGKFLEYAKGHQKHSFNEMQYIGKYGIPRCRNTNCCNEVQFSRGKPLTYCSFTCSGLNAGFSLQKTQVKIKETIIDRYGVTNVAKLPHVRQLLRNRTLDNSCYFKLSKLHIRIRNILDLKLLGFESEQRILGFSADELNKEKKIIIEINGDYIHANPKFYNENSVIKTKHGQYLAKDRWKKESLRTKILVDAGYKVFIIWESDNLEEAKKKLLELLEVNL